MSSKFSGWCDGNPAYRGGAVWGKFPNYVSLSDVLDFTDVALDNGLVKVGQVISDLEKKGFLWDSIIHFRHEDKILQAFEDGFSFGHPWTVYYPFGMHRLIIVVSSQTDDIAAQLRFS